MSRWEIAAPLTLNWTLSNRCSFNCSHCYSRHEPAQELPLGEILAAIGRVAEWGVLAINFGGGEPLLFPGLLEVIKEATRRGLRVTLNSNGYALDRDMASRLADAGVYGVGISIDSSRPEVHDRFRGVPGSHARACSALDHLGRVGIRRSISTVICRINHHEFPDMIAYGERVGVDRLNFHNFKCLAGGANNADHLDLSPSEWRKFYRSVQKRAERSSVAIGFDDPIIASLGGGAGSSLVSGSVCGKLSLAVKGDGSITPCGFIPQVIGNVLTDDLDRLWHESPLLHRLRHKTPKGKCTGCSHYSSCLGGCSARAIAVSGDPDTPDPHCWEGE